MKGRILALSVAASVLCAIAVFLMHRYRIEPPGASPGYTHLFGAGVFPAGVFSLLLFGYIQHRWPDPLVAGVKAWVLPILALGATFPLSSVVGPFLLALFLVQPRWMTIILPAVCFSMACAQNTVFLTGNDVVLPFAIVVGLALAVSQERHVLVIAAAALAVTWVPFPPLEIAARHRVGLGVLTAVAVIIPTGLAPSWVLRSLVPVVFLPNLMWILRLVAFALLPGTQALHPSVQVHATHPDGSSASCGLQAARSLCGHLVVTGTQESCGVGVWSPSGEHLWYRELSATRPDADCERGYLYVPSYANAEVVTVELASGEILHRTPVPGEPNEVWLRGQDAVFVDTDARNINLVELETGEIRTPISDRANHPWVSHDRSQIVWAETGSIESLDLDGDNTWTAAIGLSATEAEYCPDSTRIILSDADSGLVRFFELDGRPAGAIRLDPGIRYWLCEKGIGYGGNYVTGELFLVDLRDSKLLGSFAVGHRVRSLWLEPDGGRVWAASAAGAISFPTLQVTNDRQN